MMNSIKKMVLTGAAVMVMMSFATPAMARDDGNLTIQPSTTANCTQDLTGAYNPFGPNAKWHYQYFLGGIRFPVLDYYCNSQQT